MWWPVVLVFPIVLMFIEVAVLTWQQVPQKSVVSSKRALLVAKELSKEPY